MIVPNAHWKTIERANRQLALRFEKLQKAHATGDKHGITMAEMDYFQALQYLYIAVETAIAERRH